MLLYILYSFLTLLTFTNGQAVVTPNGIILGREEYSQRGSYYSFYAFQQIPYAKPPVGPLRFKDPVPAEPWEGIYNASHNDKVCFQQTYQYSSPLVESEDCLYLNVYVPKGSSKLTVMVYFHGGGFVNGAADFDSYGPHYLLEHGVIVVTVNYRLGPFGFLSTGDTVIPGNYGLKDQLLSLKWVQENIQYFGGDKTSVTIFGQEAGASSVTYQLMSEKSEGLYKAAIAQSGSLLCPWSFQRNYRSIAYRLASAIDSSINEDSSSEELLELLQNTSAENLNEASKSMFTENEMNNQIIQGYQYTPVIEPEHENAFITERMYDAVVNGSLQRVPLIIGICSEEMILDASNIDDFKTTVENMDENLDSLVNDNMHLTEKSQKEDAGQAIRNIYTDGLFQDSLGDAVQFFSDNSFGRPILHHALQQSRFSGVFFYRFSFSGTITDPRPKIEGAENVAHSDDQNYIWAFSNNSNMNQYTSEDILTGQRIRTLFTNFAKYLDPISMDWELIQLPWWPPITPNTIPLATYDFLDMNENFTIQYDLKLKNYNGWVNVYENFARKPYDSF